MNCILSWIKKRTLFYTARYAYNALASAYSVVGYFTICHFSINAAELT